MAKRRREWLKPAVVVPLAVSLIGTGSALAVAFMELPAPAQAEHLDCVAERVAVLQLYRSDPLAYISFKPTDPAELECQVDEVVGRARATQ
jgi:hypothetical protein